jgi:calcyclin binding protein
MELKVLGLENKNYTLKIANLLYPITECSSRAKKDMVVVSLKKQASGKNWSHVTETDKRAADAKAPKKREGEDAVKDPSSGLMDMMKQMYEDGDDDMKRMIAKAWTEGKGNEKQMPTMPDFNNL